MAEGHPSEIAWKGSKSPNLFDWEWIHGGSDNAIFYTVTQGVSKTEMLNFQGKLAHNVIWKIMVYLRAAAQSKEGTPTLVPAH